VINISARSVVVVVSAASIPPILYMTAWMCTDHSGMTQSDFHRGVAEYTTFVVLWLLAIWGSFRGWRLAAVVLLASVPWLLVLVEST